MTWSSLVIGLGNAGFKYDLGKDKNTIQTHARALISHFAFSLDGVVDPDETVLSQFSQKYSSQQYFSSIEEACHSVLPQFVVIASPTEFHLKNLRAVLSNCKPILILMEKPAAYEKSDVEEMINLGKKFNVTILVNFVRRCDPGFLKVKQSIDDKDFSLPAKGVVWYSKGVIHNGSHFVDLLSWWFGAPKSIEVLKTSDTSHAMENNPDFILKFKDAEIYFLGQHPASFPYYQIQLNFLDILFSFNSIDFKLHWFDTEKGPNLLIPEANVFPNELTRYQLNVLNDIDTFLHSNTTNITDIENYHKNMINLYGLQ